MPFRLRPEHLNFVRRKRMAEAFAATFAGTPLTAKADATSGRVLVGYGGGNPTVFSTNEQGFVGQIRTPLGREWNIESDAAGRATGIRNPGGSTSRVAYDERGRVKHVGRDELWLVQVGHDSVSNLTEVLYADGTREVLTYKDQKYLTGIRRRSKIKESFEYDAQNCITALVDGKGNRTQYEYGKWTRPDRILFADGSSQDFQYDERGSLKGFDRGGVHAELATDASGRVCELSYAGSGRILREFDASGQLTAIQSTAGGEIRWRYQDGRVIEEKSTSGEVKYLYDDRQRLTGLAYPDGGSVVFGWDEDDRLTSIKDWSGAETRWEYASGERGCVATYKGGLRAGRSLTPEGLTREIVVQGSGGVLLRLAYEHDAEDRVSRCDDSLSATGPQRFRYDADGRLVEGAGRTFVYDDADNLLTGLYVGGTLEFNAVNQPVSAAGGAVYLHDERGNLTEGLAKGGVWQLVWDAQNRLVEGHGPHGHRVRYGYDGLGRRAWREQGNSLTEYFWAGETQIGEIETRDGKVVRRQEYLFLPGTYTLFATRVNGEVFYAHGDHLGAPRLLTNAAGEAVWGASYDAWGVEEKVFGEATIHQPWRFPGQYADELTGLCDNRFRVYSPYLGRYLSRDPLGYVEGLNLYVYAQNDPVNGADPLGLFSWAAVGVIAAAVAVGVAVVVLAPVALPAAIILGGAAAGAVGFGLNEALNEKEFCATCIALAALKGAAIGAVAAIPFAVAPEVGGPLLFAGRGGLSGAIGYLGDVANGSHFSWSGLGKSIAISAATAGVLRYAGPKVAGLLKSEPPPPTEPYNRLQHYGRTPTRADRTAIGGESVDHDPPLVKRYYEGDPATGEKPGYLQTEEERAASAQDRSRMQPATKADQNKQGGEMAKYSKDMKKKYGL